MKLEDLQTNGAVEGILANETVTVVNVRWFGSEALELTYKTAAGKVAHEILYRHDEARLEIVEAGHPWNFNGDGAMFRLVSEAQRFRLAHLFDPLLAVHTSVVDPLPHQITAVYESMLPSNWIGNASLTWYSPDGHWQVTGFVRNFTDSRAQNSAFDLAIVDGSDEQSFEKPRRYGVSLRYNY